MRNIFFISLFLLTGATQSFGQYSDYYAHLLIDVDYRAGNVDQKYNSGSLISNYSNVVNPAQGTLQLRDGKSKSYNAECSYYIDEKRSYGVGIGLNYTVQSGNLSTDSFHVEYSTTDYKGNIFRQLISASTGITESVKGTCVNIPILLHYNRKVGTDLSIAVEAGLLYNVSTQYTGSAATTFDYEAIYKFQGSGSNLVFQYDNAPNPAKGDWLITKNEFYKTNSAGEVSSYFDGLQGRGYTVGLNQSVSSKSGKITFKPGSIGFTAQAGLRYRISRGVYGKVGLFYLSQSFENSGTNTKMLVDPKTGAYGSLMSSVTKITNTSYGIVFGVGIGIL